MVITGKEESIDQVIYVEQYVVVVSYVVYSKINIYQTLSDSELLTKPQ